MSTIAALETAYARYSARDFAFADTFFADDIRWQIVGSDFGTIHGRDAVKGFFGGLTQITTKHTITLRDSVQQGDRIAAFVEHAFTRPDGKVITVAAVHRWTFRDGQAVELFEVPDTVAIGVAFGMVPDEALAGRG